MKSDSNPHGLSTRCIHAGTHHDAATGGANSPIYTSTAFTFPNSANANIYPRYFNTPNQRVINRKLAALEQGEDALVFGSGMAAISTLLFAHLKPGDHATFQADLYGGMFDAHACYQLERGLKTLALRMRQHNENASHLARFLQEHPAVARVNYPGLPEHPDHAIAARQMRGFGGMLSFELRVPVQADHVLSRLRVVMPALSLGGVESLICVPSRTSHRLMTPAERQRAGIGDGLVRVSVGIEDVGDLLADFDQALSCTDIRTATTP